VELDNRRNNPIGAIVLYSVSLHHQTNPNHPWAG